MRTTLSIDDDVLAASKGIAERENKSLGEVISALTRQALEPGFGDKRKRGLKRNGVPLLARRPGALPVTAELVAQLRDELT